MWVVDRRERKTASGARSGDFLQRLRICISLQLKWKHSLACRNTWLMPLVLRDLRMPRETGNRIVGRCSRRSKQLKRHYLLYLITTPRAGILDVGVHLTVAFALPVLQPEIRVLQHISRDVVCLKFSNRSFLEICTSSTSQDMIGPLSRLETSFCVLYSLH